MRRLRVERHQWIHAEQQIHARIERERRVQRFVERAIDVVLPVYLDRREQSGQGARRLDRARDRDVVETPGAEGDRAAGVEIGRNEKELRAKAPEVVRPAGCCEEPAKKTVDRAVVEESRRHRVRKRRE